VMIEGRLVQVDTPHKLYRRPVTRQVATFLGEANFLPGEAGNGEVVCELGRLPLQSIHTGAVEVMIRPEELHLAPSETGCGQVIDRHYFGHDQLVWVRLESGAVLQSRLLGSAGDFYPGQRVGLTVHEGVVGYPLA